MNLTVNPAITTFVNQSICAGQTYLGHSTTGQYIDHFIATNGCDSTRTLNLTVSPAITTVVNQSICAGQTYLGHNTTGQYIDHFTASGGCDSTRTLNLTVNPAIASVVNQSICAGQTYLGHNTTGQYIDHFTAANGCDSTRTLNLTVNPAIASVMNQSICAGQTYLGHSTTGQYIDHFTAANGCDSARTLNLTVLPKVITDITKTICEGQSYFGHTQTGFFIDTYTSAAGCDSIRRLDLHVVKYPVINLGSDTALCFDNNKLILSPGVFDSYLWQNGSVQSSFTVTGAGLYTVKVTNFCGAAYDEIKVGDNLCAVYFPNSFTPNNDGKNDQFNILKPYHLTGYSLTIFGRWGEKVFATNDYSKGWDGNIGGKPAPEGVYIWYCKFAKGTGIAEVHSGTVILMR